VVLEPSEEGGYTAIIPSLPGCISEGDTMEEALEFYLEPVEDDQIFAPNAETVELAL
jgi:predicted RNase H-like HicB family nuclease